MNRRAIVALFCVALAGCPSSHPSEDAGTDAGADARDASTRFGGVDPDRRLVELSSVEWADLCQWIASLPPQEIYYCEGDTFRGSDDCPGCTPYNWTWERCWESSHPYWSMQPAGCSSTVAMLAACIEQMAETVCWQAYPDTPTCLAVECPEP